MHNGDHEENINADKEKLSHESILLQFMHQNEDVIQGDSSRKLRKTTRVFQEKLTTKAFLIKILIQIVKQDLKLLYHCGKYSLRLANFTLLNRTVATPCQ